MMTTDPKPPKRNRGRPEIRPTAAPHEATLAASRPTNQGGCYAPYTSRRRLCRGSTSNVYYSDTQYYDTTGKIAYSSSFKGAINDTGALPPSGCRDRYTSVCLTDQQLQTEIARVIAANHLPTGDGTEFFLFTPKNVGSCDGSSCSHSYYCAYHSNFTDNGADVLYANMPYAVPSRPARVGAGSRLMAMTPIRLSTSRVTSTTRRSPMRSARPG
jgi:hypothetical protein